MKRTIFNMLCLLLGGLCIGLSVPVGETTIFGSHFKDSIILIPTGIALFLAAYFTREKYRVPTLLESKLSKLLVDDQTNDLLRCPNCTGTTWIEGAGGGSFGNIECGTCHKRYNNLGPFGLEELK